MRDNRSRFLWISVIILGFMPDLYAAQDNIKLAETYIPKLEKMLNRDEKSEWDRPEAREARRLQKSVEQDLDIHDSNDSSLEFDSPDEPYSSDTGPVQWINKIHKKLDSSEENYKLVVIDGLNLIDAGERSLLDLYRLVGIRRVLQEDCHGIAGCVCRRYAQEPSVRRLFLASDGDSPVPCDVVCIVLVAGPGCEQFTRVIWRENGAGLSGAGGGRPIPLDVLNAEHQPGSGHCPCVGKRSCHQRHLQRRYGLLPLADGLCS